MNKENDQKQLYLGIDGGGSKCRAILYSDDKGIVAEAISGPANALRGVEKAQQHIVEATDLALSQLQLAPEYKSELIAGIGLAGLNLQACMTQMKQWLSPFKHTYYTTDLHIACLGAHGGQDGAVMIIGTGSSALVCEGETLIELGGHGFPVGDAGSGAWFGFKAIEVTLKAMEGLEAHSPMTQALAQYFQVEKAIDLAQRVAQFTPTEYAKLAPLVIDKAQNADLHALNVVTSGAQYLSQLATKALDGRSLPLSLIGGLAPRLVPYLSPQVTPFLQQAAQPPEVGAVLFAKQQYQTTRPSLGVGAC